MRRHIAFLRGINLGKRRLSMSRLRQLFEEMGFDEVETFIASGNVLFNSKISDRHALETKISKQLGKSLGYEVETFVREDADVAAIAKAKIFPEQEKAGIRVHVAFLHEKLPTAVAKKLAAVRTPVDEFRVIGTEFFWLCRVLTSESKVWTLPEVRALKLPSCTMRNLTSIRKLVARHISPA